MKGVLRFLLFWSMLYSLGLSAQGKKFEYETRIEDGEVPQAARDFVAASGEFKRLKWYREQGLEAQESFEAKVKLRGNLYSIEFDSLGAIEDIEYVVKLRSLPDDQQAMLGSVLNQNLLRAKIQKLQIQLTGSEIELSAFLREVGSGETHEKAREGLTPKWEIIASGREDGKPVVYEFLLSWSGKVERKDVEVQRNADILMY